MWLITDRIGIMNGIYRLLPRVYTPQVTHVEKNGIISIDKFHFTEVEMVRIATVVDAEQLSVRSLTYENYFCTPRTPKLC